MKIQAAVKHETARIVVGVAILSAVMLVVFAAIGKFDMSVLWGTLLGGGYAVLNFFLMAMTVQQAAEQMNGVHLPAEEEENAAQPDEQAAEQKEELPQQKKARSLVQRSYYFRMALTALVAVLAVKSPVFHAVPAIIALFFPRMVITAQPLLQKIRKGE